MLHSFNVAPQRLNDCVSVPCRDDRYDRNEQEDFKLAIDYIYELKAKLNKLHPSILDKVEMMLQRPKY